MSELEKREMHFATILDRGEALLLQQHPASKTIEEHLQALGGYDRFGGGDRLVVVVDIVRRSHIHHFFCSLFYVFVNLVCFVFRFDCNKT